MVRIIYAHTDSLAGHQHWVCISLCVCPLTAPVQSPLYRARRCQDRSYSSAHQCPPGLATEKYAYSEMELA